MSTFVPVACPICHGEVDILRGYGAGNCCGKDCHIEWEWRRALAITGQPYRRNTDSKPIQNTCPKCESESLQRFATFKMC